MESLLSTQSKAKVKPLRFKRSNQYLVEEGGPSDTDSRYDAPAGLPPSHKRVRVGEYKDPAYAGPSTSALNEVRPMGTSTPLTPISSEITKDESSSIAGDPHSVYPQSGLHPHGEVPEAAPFSRRFAPSKNSKADYRRTSSVLTKAPAQAAREGLADKTRKLIETGSIKKKKRGRITAANQNVNTGERLLQDIISTGRYEDPFSEWFDRLRMPCHRERVERVSKAFPPSLAARGVPLAKRLVTTPTLVGNTVGTTGRVPERNPIYTEDATDSPRNPLTSKTAASACHLTQDQMHKYLAWEFPIFKLKENSNPGDADSLYDDPFPYGPTTGALHDITLPVGCKYRHDGRPRALDRRITSHLQIEAGRFFDGGRLCLPRFWQDIPARSRPWSYILPKRHTPFVYDKVKDVPNREAYSHSGNSFSSGSSDSDGTVIPWPPAQSTVTPANNVESSIEEPPEDALGMEMLLGRYSFKDDDPLEHKVAQANGLKKEVQVVDGPRQRYRHVVAMYSRIDGIPSAPIEHLEKSEIKARDKKYGHGNTMYNWEATDKMRLEPYIIERFLAFPGVAEEAPGEAAVEAEVGCLLRGIVAGPGLIDRDQASVPFPQHLRPVGSNPWPDKYARADNKSLEWPETLLPVLFGAECKPTKTYDEYNTRAQLAAAFHGTLVVLILYYMDTRHSDSAALPAWLFLYGIEYTDKGVIIHTHHPAYFIDESDPDKSHWILKATMVSDAYSGAFISGVDESVRLKLLASLFKIRSHSLHVLERLRLWTRGRKVLGTVAKSPDVLKWSSKVPPSETDESTE